MLLFIIIVKQLWEYISFSRMMPLVNEILDSWNWRSFSRENDVLKQLGAGWGKEGG